VAGLIGACHHLPAVMEDTEGGVEAADLNHHHPVHGTIMGEQKCDNLTNNSPFFLFDFSYNQPDQSQVRKCTFHERFVIFSSL